MALAIGRGGSHSGLAGLRDLNDEGILDAEVPQHEHQHKVSPLVLVARDGEPVSPEPQQQRRRGDISDDDLLEYVYGTIRRLERLASRLEVWAEKGNDSDGAASTTSRGGIAESGGSG